MTPEHFEDLRAHFDDGQIVELVSAIAMFGWLNRWNDTMATDLEDQPFDVRLGASPRLRGGRQASTASRRQGPTISSAVAQGSQVRHEARVGLGAP